MTTERIKDSGDVLKIVESYTSLSSEFVNPPGVSLKLITQKPNGEAIGVRDVSASVAVQCYSPGKAGMVERSDEKYQTISDNTLDAGHHTTRMHYHYTWRLDGISRQFIHDVLHDHPFQNSDQQSQRYVEIAEGSYLTPKLEEEQREIFLEVASMSNRFYFELLESLSPALHDRMVQMYPPHTWKSEKAVARYKDKEVKIAQEVARSVLPIAQQSNLYHTLSEIQVLRLFRASQMGQFNTEAKFVIGKMVESIVAADPTFVKELRKPLPEVERDSMEEMYIAAQHDEFDSLLGDRNSKLVDFPFNIERTIPMSVRNVLGRASSEMSDDEAWQRVLDPSVNSYLADTYDIGMLDKVTQTLRNANFVLATKYSHAADSQRQRHRRTPGATPPLSALYSGKADYITPLIIRENPELQERYDQMMERIYNGIAKAIDAGIPKEIALTLLPNAHAVRVMESGDLFDWLHRLKQRLCYLAQEEIFFTSVEQAMDLAEKIPKVPDAFLAPCGIRKAANISPNCPEGIRYCGVPVFDMALEEYTKHRLI